MPGYEPFLLCDFHVHTVFSDGNVWPPVRVAETWRQGLDALAITDHIEYRPHKDELTGSHNRPYEIAAALAGDRGRLQELHSSLRQRMESSALMDAAGFARSVEAAYREMWQSWCRSPS